MENKYYTPKIEELHVGFECEIQSSYGWQKGSYPTIFQEDTLSGFEVNDLGVFKTLEKRYKYLRVKYLDREDIESLGWVKSLYKTTEVYQLDKFVITSYSRLEEDGLVIDISLLPSFKDSELRRIFRGIIKNKSELKRVMEQLTINKL
jgi:hypothetical protein